MQLGKDNFFREHEIDKRDEIIIHWKFHTYSYKLSLRNGDKKDRRYRKTLLHSVCSAREFLENTK